MNTNVREFLLKVLPWPDDTEPGYINVHVQTRFDAKRSWTGSPTRNVEDFLQEIYTYRSWPKPPDIFMCLSRQADVRVRGDKQKPAKSQASALALRALFLDIDIK